MAGWFHSHEKAAYRTINTGLLICMVLFGAKQFLGIGVPGVAHFIVAIIVVGGLTAVNHMTVRGRGFCLSILFIIFCAGVAAGSVENPAYWKSFFLWLTGRGTVPREWATGYGLLQTALIAAGCYLVQIFFEKMPGLKMGAAAILLGILIFCLLARRELSHFGMAFIICFLLLVWAEWVQEHWEKKRVKDRGFQAHTFWILPFMTLYLLLLIIVPAPKDPYDWTWAKTVYHQIRDSFHACTQNIKWGNKEGFGMAFTGFSREGDLGGDLQEDAREIMRVRIQPSSEGYLYLTGTVYDTFDGREWSQMQQGYAGAVFLDTAQTLYAVRDYDRHYQSDYMKEVKVSIRYEDFNTGYVFAPLKVWDLASGDSNRRVFGQRGQVKDPDDTVGDGILRWNGQKGYGTEYELRYFRMNAGQPQFDLFLETAGKTDEINRAVWNEVMRESETHSGQVFTIQNREDYRRAVYELYLGDTGLREMSLSEELKSYLEEILEGTETDVGQLYR